MSSNIVPILTAYIFVSKENAWDGLTQVLKALTESGIEVELHEATDAVPDINPKNPRVYVSLGKAVEEFKSLFALPYHEKKRWLHYTSVLDIQSDRLFYCWIRQTDPLPENKIIPETRFSSDVPLVSIFTASYKSKEKIQRPYRSLLKQTYTNWEWIIVDDSGDEDATYKEDLLPLEDSRVRRYRQDCRNGYIGAIKRYAAGLCTGEILVEVDHDDDLTPDCLERIVRAFQKHPDCGFAFGDCAEVYVGNNFAHWYGWDCGFGYDIYYRVWMPEMNRWQNALRNTALNANTIRHLVGLPNHPRAWTRECYHILGGHREELLVADDYDMLVRTFLCTKYVCIPHLCYIQYLNNNRDNSTFTRNGQIQILVKELNNYYGNRIRDRIKELDLPDLVPYKRVWEREIDDAGLKTAHIIDEDTSKVSMIFPIPYSCAITKQDLLFQTIAESMETGFKEVEIVVIGCVPPEIEMLASKAPMGAIRWWIMEQTDSLETCIRYGKICSSCKEKVVVLPQELQNRDDS